MRAFEYASPETREDAVKLLSSEAGKTAILAGGTDLISLMKDEVVTPGRVVNIKSVEGLGGISYDAGSGLRIGALLTLDELEADSRIRSDYPSLQQAVDGVRSAQIRSMGTVGGDLCQRPRCWYYRHGFGLLAKWQGKTMVPDGDNRYHAILGTSGDALFVNPSSLAPALIALGATVEIFGPSGARETPLSLFYRAPAADDEREYHLAANEIVTGVRVAGNDVQNATYEVRQREALDWPLASASVALKFAARGLVRRATVVMGHVAATPWVSEAAGQELAGKTVDEATAEAAGRKAVTDAKPLSRNSYKVRLAQTAVKRAVLRAAGKEV
jgi:xanthine dehydrogenase YagS FAD-binding subunit